MASSGFPSRSAGRVLAATGVVALGVVVWTYVSVPVADLAPPPAVAPIATPAPEAVKPEFDIVRVAPGGSAVLAGRAAPGSTVTVQQGAITLGQALADAQGAWVLLPDKPLTPGAAALSLTAQDPHGVNQAGDSTVVVVVPSAAAPALAVLMPSTGPSRLLQAPAPGGKLGLDTVDYDERGAIRFAGRAPANAPVRIYLDNKAAGDAVADTTGHWALAPGGIVQPGLHTLRLDQLDQAGHVASRVEMPFLREAMATAQLAPGQVVVQPRATLWLLARQAYGRGIRYTVIYQANREQIRDARLIYPGQVFTVPVP